MFDQPGRESWLSKAWPLGAVLSLCLLAGSAIGLLVVPHTPSPEESPLLPERLLLLGNEFSAQENSLQEMKRQARKHLARTFTLRIPGHPSLALPLGRWGVEVDEERLSNLHRDVRDASSPFALLQKAPAGPVQLPVPLRLDSQQAVSHLLRAKARIDRPPSDAKFDFDRQQVVKETVGQALDVDSTLLALETSLYKGELAADAVVDEQAPRKLARDLQGLSFDSILGHFETRYSRSQRAADRTYNLKLAAQALSGTVLLPSEEFDFNRIVGARDEANGYRVATVIADGELVDGIGGGTCQISGTLHGAAFFAGLDIVERYPHTRPSSYIKMGMDATVVYPTINFRFKNPFDFPVLLRQTVKEGVVRAEIIGAEIDQVVTLIRRIDQAIPYEQLERPDSGIATGKRALAQRGIPGFRLHRYRTIRSGSHTRRQKWHDVYPPTAQVVRVGTGPHQSAAPRSVSTPEYLADELLILTQKRPQAGKPGELAENREPGRTGSPGWTAEEGMPQWDP